MIYDALDNNISFQRNKLTSASNFTPCLIFPTAPTCCNVYILIFSSGFIRPLLIRCCSQPKLRS